MRLIELNPKWIVDTQSAGKRNGMGVLFDCPHCVERLPDQDPVRLGVPFTNPIDEGKPMPDATATWERVGDTYDALSLVEPVRVEGHGTIEIVGGEVTWTRFVHRPDTAIPLTDLEPEFLNVPSKQRFGLGIRFRCPHCPARVGVLFANPLDEGTPVKNASLPMFARAGGRDDRGGLDASTLTLLTQVQIPEHVDFEVRNGFVIIAGA